MNFNDDISLFNTKYSFTNINVTGGTFRYLLAGNINSNQTLVFLNGGTNCADMWFKYVEALSKEYKVLLFDYSLDFTNNQTQITAMHELFTKLNIEKPIFIGASFGGLMAQIYTQKYLSEVGGLVLLSTAALSEYTIKKLKHKKIFIPLLLWVISHFNYDKLKIKLIKSTMSYVKNESEEIQNYCYDMFTYVFNDYTAEKDYHITSLLADIFTQQYVTKDTFSCLKDKILLMLPKKDYFTPDMQKDFIQIMNNPRVEYVDGGHIATVLYVEQYLKVIRSFLEAL